MSSPEFLPNMQSDNRLAASRQGYIVVSFKRETIDFYGF